jgi:hypothetical protein
MALCGVARLASSALRLPFDPAANALPTHASMLEMLSAKHPSIDYTGHFDEVTNSTQASSSDAEPEGDVVERVKDEDPGLYDNLVWASFSTWAQIGSLAMNVLVGAASLQAASHQQAHVSAIHPQQAPEYP